jgi:hypothetical protein
MDWRSPALRIRPEPAAATAEVNRRDQVLGVLGLVMKTSRGRLFSFGPAAPPNRQVKG